MHSIIQNLEVKIWVVWKFKRHKIKNHSDMLRILRDPCVYVTVGWEAGRTVHTHTHTHHMLKIMLPNTHRPST